MSTQLTVPSAFVPRAAALRDPSLNDKLSDGISASYARVHYKGKVFSIHYKGDTHPILRPDDGTPSGYLDVVILSAAPFKSKSFYEAYDPNASAGKRPVCSSLHGDVPDQGVQEAQSTACAICPKNQLKPDAQSGKKFRECGDFKRVAVYLPAETTMRTLGTVVDEPVFLRIPAGSLQGLATMGQQMDTLGYHYSEFITRITFDPSEAFPKMVFTPIGQPLLGEVAKHMLAMRNDPLTERILGEGESFATAQLPPPANVVSFPPKATTQAAPPPPAQITAAVTPQVSSFETNGHGPRHAQVVGGVATAPPPPPTEIVMPAQRQPAAPTGLVAQVMQTVQDTGQPQVAEESDEVIDSYISALVKTSI